MLDRLDALKVFCVAAEHSTFKDAATKLNVSPQVVTRCIRELETEFGEILFVRSTRNINITAFGKQFYEKAKRALAVVDEAFVKENEDSLAVRITAPPALSCRIIMPALGAVLNEYPDIRIDLRLSNNIADVVAEGIDIGIRGGTHISDSRFIAREVADIDHVIVAVPHLIEKYGIPNNLDELSLMPTVGYFSPDRNKVWPWFFANDVNLELKNCMFMTDDSETELNAVLHGFGFGQIAYNMAAPYLKNGQLIEVLPEYMLKGTWKLFIYRPQSGPVPKRVRVIYDKLIEYFANSELMPAIPPVFK